MFLPLVQNGRVVAGIVLGGKVELGPSELREVMAEAMPKDAAFGAIGDHLMAMMKNKTKMG